MDLKYRNTSKVIQTQVFLLLSGPTMCTMYIAYPIGFLFTK